MGITKQIQLEEAEREYAERLERWEAEGPHDFDDLETEEAFWHAMEKDD